MTQAVEDYIKEALERARNNTDSLAITPYFLLAQSDCKFSLEEIKKGLDNLGFPVEKHQHCDNPLYDLYRIV